MSNAISDTRPDITPSHTSDSVLAPLAVADRCDRCGAQAFVRARMSEGGELVFCGHHGREATPRLISLGAEVRDDTGLIPA
ncbi:hypothetical protein CLV35_2794 [Motilibacter peucedani]|uniref:DUF7455 domain-containing protein n=1 Tax=Motilibacter peucedani TaxID=598650 RepID=A0A420XMQ0_9ACTN|nr:hypothetical protein [Motilibacter peucedani]RKS72547.1 hypothetical protein CLV35_2794 [Motilibacter peucedani]